MGVPRGTEVIRRTVVGALALAIVVPGIALGAPGDRDPSFGRRGIATPSGGAIYAAAGTPDGGTVYLTPSGAPGLSPLELRKVDGAGALDATFGGDGVADLPAALSPTDIAVLPDGRILVGGFAGPDAAAARLRPDGSADLGFGSAGLATSALAGKAASANSILAEADGGAALAISVREANPPPYDSSSGVLRFTADGDPDPSFGTDGVSDLVPNSAGALARDVSGRYLLGDAYQFNGGPTVARYDAGGKLDATFGSAGLAPVPVPYFSVFSGRVYAMAVDAENRPLILHSGWDLASTKGGGFAKLIRLDASGAVDATFDPSQIFTASREQRRIFSPTGLAIDKVGRIVVSGDWATTRYDGHATDPAVARLLPSGSPDPAFGQAGLAIVPALELGTSSATLNGLQIQDGGKIVSFGSSDGYHGPALIRLLGSGGRADADADGIADRRDRCRLTAGHKREDGCPLLQRRVKIVGRANNGFYNGAVIGLPGCANKAPVKLMRARPGRDEVVGRTRTAGTARWTISGDFPIGRYYAIAKRVRNEGVGICVRARSRIAR